MAASHQSTLEIEQLLQLLLKELSPAVELDGLQYLNDHKSMQFLAGRKSSHNCGYRLITAQDHLGEIVFNRSKKFIEKELGILESLLSSLISPRHNSLKYTPAVKAAFLDPLTGISNINTLSSALKREIDLSKRHYQALSVLLIDIDHMGDLNDHFGHATGNKVLSALARRVMQLCHTTDAVFRYEDDQFLVILHNTAREGAQVISRRIMRSVQK